MEFGPQPHAQPPHVAGILGDLRIDQGDPDHTLARSSIQRRISVNTSSLPTSLKIS